MSLKFLLVELCIGVIFRGTFGHLSKGRRAWPLLFESSTNAVFIAPAVGGAPGNVEMGFYPLAKSLAGLTLRFDLLPQVIEQGSHSLLGLFGGLAQPALELSYFELFNFVRHT